MSAEQFDSPAQKVLERLQGPIPRWLFYVLIPGFAGPVLILGFIFVSEMAHDPDRCPYERQAERPLSEAIKVREDARRCLPGIEERRFTAVRPDSERILGHRRFASGAFEAEKYRWRAALSPHGEVSVTVDNAGHPQAVFREGTPQERAER